MFVVGQSISHGTEFVSFQVTPQLGPCFLGMFGGEMLPLPALLQLLQRMQVHSWAAVQGSSRTIPSFSISQPRMAVKPTALVPAIQSNGAGSALDIADQRRALTDND